MLLVLAYKPYRNTLYSNLKSNPWLIAILLTYPLIIFFNLTSLGSTHSAQKVLVNWPWPLLSLITLIIIKYSFLKNIFLKGLILGHLIAFGYSLYLFYNLYGFELPDNARLASFWDISRWGTFNSLIIPLYFYYFIYHFNVFKKSSAAIDLAKTTGYFLLLTLSTYFLFLSKSRAPYLGLLASFIFIFIFSKKAKPYFIAPALALTFVLFFNPNLINRLSSIGEVQTNTDGQISSKDASNAGRLNMWKVGLDLFLEHPLRGVGFQNSEIWIKDFLSKKDSEYQKKYTQVEFSYKDHHSSYLSSLVQNGPFFTFYFLGATALITLLSLVRTHIIYLKDLNFNNSNEIWLLKVILISIIANYAISFVFYTSYESYEMIFFFPALTGLAYLLPLTSKKVPSCNY